MEPKNKVETSPQTNNKINQKNDNNPHFSNERTPVSPKKHTLITGVFNKIKAKFSQNPTENQTIPLFLQVPKDDVRHNLNLNTHVLSLYNELNFPNFIFMRMISYDNYSKSSEIMGKINNDSKESIIKYYSNTPYELILQFEECKCMCILYIIWHLFILFLMVWFILAAVMFKNIGYRVLFIILSLVFLVIFFALFFVSYKGVRIFKGKNNGNYNGENKIIQSQNNNNRNI